MQKSKKKILGLSGLLFVAATTFIAHTLPPIDAYANSRNNTKVEANIQNATAQVKIDAPRQNEKLNPVDVEAKISFRNVRTIKYKLVKKPAQVIALAHNSYDPSNGTPDKFKVPDLENGDYILTVEVTDRNNLVSQESVEFTVDSSTKKKGDNSGGGSSWKDDDEDKNKNIVDKPYDPKDPLNPNPKDPYNPFNPFNPDFDPKNPNSPTHKDSDQKDKVKTDSGEHYVIPSSNKTDENGNPIISIRMKPEVCLVKVQAYTLPDLLPLFNPPIAFKNINSATRANFALDFVSNGAKSGKYKIVTATFLKDKDGNCTKLYKLPSVFELDYNAKKIGVPNTGFFSFVGISGGKTSYILTAVAAALVMTGILVIRKKANRR